MQQEPTDVIRLYLDDDTEPFRTARPPLRFQFTTLNLADGPHKLRIEAHNGLAGASIREIPFFVRNGVAITVSGIEPGQEVAGQVGVIINAYAGNTEVDFEPTRAETPQPIPTWAWLVFLVVIAWTMFYVLNPNVRPPPAEALAATGTIGQRVFVDTCAKCHQENGEGLGVVPPLKGADLVLDHSPLGQLKKVVAGGLQAGPGPDAPGSGRSKMQMPEFGPLLGNAEIVAAINHTRRSWGNQSPLLEPKARRAPEEIREVDDRLAQALQEAGQSQPRNVDMLSYFYSSRARLVRPADGIDVEGNRAVVAQWGAWFDGVKEVNSLQVVEAAYDVNDPRADPQRSVHMGKGTLADEQADQKLQEETWVYAHGLVSMSGVMADGKPFEHVGRFIRFYVLEGPVGGEWRIAFDFSTLPMPIGCVPDPATPKGGVDPNCPPGQAAGNFFFGDVVRLLSSLGAKATGSRHGNFWESLSYEDFVAYRWDVGGRVRDRDGRPLPAGSTIRLIEPGNGAGSNLVRALRDGVDVLVDVPGRKEPLRIDIPREPRNSGGRYMGGDDVDRISAWIDRGMPKERPAPPPEDAPEGNGAKQERASSEKKEEGGETPAAGDWRPDDVDFAGVQELFRKLKPRAKSAPHKAFWDKPYAEFVAFEFELRSEEGRVRLIEKGKPGAESNLVKALTDGKGLTATLADGSTKKVDVDRMPSNGDPMPAEDVEKIRRWIDHGAPEKRPQ